MDYDKVRVLITTGIFFLLALQSQSARKVLVIFADELTNNEYRLLRIIEKIS